MTYSQKLDIVLSYFNTPYEGEVQDQKNLFVEHPWQDISVRLGRQNVAISNAELQLILANLEDTGYLKSKMVSLNKAIRWEMKVFFITLNGKIFIENGGFTAKDEVLKKEAALKQMQNETIEFSHYIAKKNKENYVSDRWKFAVPIIISAGALCFTAANYYGNGKKIEDVSKRVDAIEANKSVVSNSIDTIAKGDEEHIIDSAIKLK